MAIGLGRHRAENASTRNIGLPTAFRNVRPCMPSVYR